MEPQQETLHNPPFKILQSIRCPLRETTGDDLMDFDVLIEVEGHKHWAWVPFDFVVDHCKTHHPEIAKYIRSVRKNVKGLGPKHSKMFEIMDEEGFDLLPYIYSCMKGDYNLPQVIEKIRYPRASRSGIIDKDGNVTPVDFSEKADELEDVMAEMRKSTIRNEAFMDDLLEYLNEQAMERYPEIFNAEPELIKEYEKNLISWVRNIGEGYDKLAFRATSGPAL